MQKLKILGLSVANLKPGEAIETIKGFLSDGKKHYIVTPNPEIILVAQKDEELFYIINTADLSLPDGFGLKIASWFSKENLLRVTGADLTPELLTLCEKDKISVGFVLWDKGLTSKQDLETALKNKYPNLIFSIAVTDRQPNTIPAEDFFKTEPQIVFCSFGAPYQEKFAYHALPKMKSAKVILGVGGTIDYISNKAKRAPQAFRYIGLEWLWRLFTRPERINRIIKATIVFPWLFFKRQFIYPFFFRPNVCCLLYKKDNSKYKILLVERQGEPGHWQMPQGGTDGEPLLVAGARELREEINTDKFITKIAHPDLYIYKFGNRPSETEEQANNRRRNTGYKGQRQGLFIAEYTGRDEDIKVNFWDHMTWKWVDSDKLVDEVHLVRKRAAERFLKKFKEFVKQK
jgi:N-acetylglucosaminyldiphosphoundecaprenol N-acetyl-beta-D-mannosaminyltransferase